MHAARCNAEALRKVRERRLQEVMKSKEAGRVGSVYGVSGVFKSPKGGNRSGFRINVKRTSDTKEKEGTPLSRLGSKFGSFKKTPPSRSIVVAALTPPCRLPAIAKTTTIEVKLDTNSPVVGTIWTARDDLCLLKVHPGSPADLAGAGVLIGYYLVRVGHTFVTSVDEMRCHMDTTDHLKLTFSTFTQHSAAVAIQRFYRTFFSSFRYVYEDRRSTPKKQSLVGGLKQRAASSFARMRSGRKKSEERVETGAGAGGAAPDTILPEVDFAESVVMPDYEGVEKVEDPVERVRIPSAEKTMLSMEAFPHSLIIPLQSYARRRLAVQSATVLRIERSRRLEASLRKHSAAKVGRGHGVSGIFRAPSISAGFLLKHNRIAAA